ncbi:hypothetical protein JG687_00009880 [Phytophthora cactorum]|uniref:Nucleotide-diphospho-sugar transferase n=1 Tax=Phytophthora cactorum TaxID=29920 RepID=A0A329RVM5_9STRA|nr:hypothetical protein Pcac1_g8794 [Phytophthora cactorum]KAG2811961.1 hypothetical protein PC112_g15382 [Phytophthora cactorum]KAG2812959.1 hypothetical protein PC111_g14596 [Phytophthora cactorum]KAG2851706.1 hypothetical protein PC113_g15674 [Phytophthora cactorum]KAG2890963.1 hypothetical protein PC114_g17201 [Phytophthora cactorum]
MKQQVPTIEKERFRYNTFNLMVGNTIANSRSGDTARWHARLAALLAASGKYDSAAAHYGRALRVLDEVTTADSNPENGTQRLKWRLQWQFELAATEAKRGRHQDAIALYQEILKTEPECVEVQVNLAAQLAIVDASRLEEALGLCMRALALRPVFAEAHYNRNMLLRRLGRQSEAVRVYWEYLVRDIGADIVKQSMPEELARAVLSSDGVGLELRTGILSCDGSEDVYASEDNGVTVVCVKWGTKYGAEYVNRLYNSTMRHRGGLHVAFACLTDNIEGIDLHVNLTILLLDGGWKGWWNKCQLFSSAISAKLRALGHSRCLYLDLDTVVVGPLVDLLMWSPPSGVLGLLKTDQMANEQREGGYNSSIMAWRIDNDADAASLLFLYSFLHAHFAAVSKYIYKFDHWLEMAHASARFLEDIFPDQIVEYRSLDEEAVSPPNATIVCFPLLPKPHSATAPWVAQHWV